MVLHIRLICVTCLSLNVLTCCGQFSWIPGYSYFWQNTETCNEDWIPGNMSEFQSSFRKNVFGQPLVEQIVASAITAHLKGNPKKALTLSFHGWPGGGKNYVASFLAQAIYKKGMKSAFVKYYNARTDFTRENDVLVYQDKLRQELKTMISSCPTPMFIFDEVDMMPQKVLDAIHPFIDYHEHVSDVDPRKAIFIFLSNTGGNEISDLMLELWKKGFQRNNLKVGDFQPAIRLAAFNTMGGLRHSDNINSHLITYFIPFLPLEKSHILQCIESEFRKKGIGLPRKEVIDDILLHITFTSKDSHSSGLFSTSGCKNIDVLVSTIVETIGSEGHEEHDRSEL